MKAKVLLLLRISIGWLLVLWGIDKIVHVEHAAAVFEHFYLGAVSAALILNILGAAEVLIGLGVVVGWMRRWTYPVTILLTAVSLLSVWKSILDPWGWKFDGTNILLYPSLIIFAGALVLWAFRDDDPFALDRR